MPPKENVRTFNNPGSQRRHASFDCTNLNNEPNPLGGRLI